MGLSIEELQLQSSECLPAREVLTLLGGRGGQSCDADSSNTNNQYGVINVGTGDIVEVASGNNVQLCDILNGSNFLNGVNVLGNQG